MEVAIFVGPSEEASIRSLARRAAFCLATSMMLLIAPAVAGAATTKAIDNILAASVDSGTGVQGAVTLHARVRLDNTCLSHPRFSRSRLPPTPDGDGVLSIAVVARSSERTGNMCAMHVRDVDVPLLILKRRALLGVRSIRVAGSFKSALVSIASTAH